MSKTSRQVFSDTSPAAAGTAASTKSAISLGRYDELTILAELVGATGGTLDVYIQECWDVDANGNANANADWFDVCHFTQLAAGAAAVKYRVVTQRDSTVQTVGKNTTPALAAGKVCGLPWGPLVRVLYVAGVSTSAGAAVKITFGLRSQNSGDD